MGFWSMLGHMVMHPCPQMAPHETTRSTGSRYNLASTHRPVLRPRVGFRLRMVLGLLIKPLYGSSSSKVALGFRLHPNAMVCSSSCPAVSMEIKTDHIVLGPLKAIHDNHGSIK